MRRLAMLEFVDLTIGPFFQTIWFGVSSRYGSIRMLYESDRIGVIDLLGLRFRTLTLSAGLL